MIGRMIAPAAQMMLLGSPEVQKTTFSDDRRHFRELVLMLDGDEPGRRASRMVAAQLRGRLPLRIAWAPEGRQPDQLSDPEIQRILDGRTALC
jgi:hypothetical protein